MKKILILVLALSFLFVSSANAATDRKVTTDDPLETDSIALNLGAGVDYIVISDNTPGYILSFHPDSITDLMYYSPDPEKHGIHTPVPFCSLDEFKAFIMKNNNAIHVSNLTEEDVQFYETTFAGEYCYAWKASYDYNGLMMHDLEIYRISTMDYFSFHTAGDNTLDETAKWIESILTWKYDPDDAEG